MKMTCYEELVRRGLIAQVTDEKEISNMINNGKAVFYIIPKENFEEKELEVIRNIKK